MHCISPLPPPKLHRHVIIALLRNFKSVKIPGEGVWRVRVLGIFLNVTWGWGDQSARNKQKRGLKLDLGL